MENNDGSESPCCANDPTMSLVWPHPKTRPGRRPRKPGVDRGPGRMVTLEMLGNHSSTGGFI